MAIASYEVGEVGICLATLPDDRFPVGSSIRGTFYLVFDSEGHAWDCDEEEFVKLANGDMIDGVPTEEFKVTFTGNDW